MNTNNSNIDQSKSEWREIAPLSASSQQRRLVWAAVRLLFELLKRKKKHTQPRSRTSRRRLRLCKRAQGGLSLARSVVRLEGRARGRLPETERKTEKKHFAQGVAAAPTPSVSSKWRYDVIGQRARAGRPAYARVDANRTRDLALWLRLAVWCRTEETSAGSLSTCWGELKSSTSRWGTEFRFSV